MVLRLVVEHERMRQLERLQEAFAQACNALGGIVAQNRCWNRVALHHIAYYRLREQFPALGSQMICNAIYSVSRTARYVYQNPNSPWCIDKRPDAPLPVIHFAATAPVYFDRHTLSVRGGGLSMHSLDGRLHFQGALELGNAKRFREERLKEIVLSRDAEGFFLVFSFGDDAEALTGGGDMPQYVIILDSAELAGSAA